MSTVLAGASVIDITSPVGVEMGGYGARKGVATGIHDNLNVRTLVLDDGTTKLVMAICDFVGVGHRQRDAPHTTLGSRGDATRPAQPGQRARALATEQV